MEAAGEAISKMEVHDWNRDKIDREVRVPIYRQLKEIIKSKIEKGDFKPGTRIPTEYELCEIYDISRISVRQALTELANEGLLYRRPGQGTFVNHEIRKSVPSIRVMLPENRWVPPLQEAVGLYNQDAEKVKLEVEVLGRPQLRNKILSAVGKGVAPDLALVDWAWVTEFADLRFLKSLDRLDSHWLEEFKTDLFPAFRTNTFYGVQPEASVSVLWYRKDWFLQEGVQPPHTWNELIEVSRHFKRLKRFPLAFVGGTKAGETTTYQLLPFIWAAGGDLLSENRVALDEKAVYAVQFLVDLIHKHKVVSPEVVAFAWDKPARLFAQGNVALAVGGSYEKALIQEVSGWDDAAFRERVGCIPIPAPSGGSSASVVGGMVYVIFRQSKDAKSVLEILKQVASPELMRTFCVETGRTPTRVSVVQTLDPETNWFSYQVSQFLQSARSRPAIPQYAKVSEQFQLMIENALTKRMTPKKAVEEARKIINFLIS